ncbi:MAG: DNA polymerase II large subunit, partial [Candidatus Thermoplasmatota archaeon]|nr:DNA polymerase II large subunit [Candidatus Thermoplasmatota archaeon]
MGGDLSNNIAASSDLLEYFNSLQKEIDFCYTIAEKARKKGFDPELVVEIPQALDLAARVEQLVGPKNIASKIREATKKIGDRELVSIEIAKEIVNGKKYKFKTKEEALDQAIRTGLAILTEGVLVAPLEGIAEVKIGKNKDGTDYVDLYFSGPIRSAGGTGQAMSVLIADVVRREMGIGKFQPTEGEIERYKEEIPLYKRVQHLQYTPSVDEIDKIVRNCPVCINGEGTEDEEVTGFRDLPRVGTNRLRGGACLVIAEGLCLKAPKILKHVKKLKLENWDFLDIFTSKTKEPDKKDEKVPKILPSSKYMGDVIAGRPVFSHPSRKGGFRLRYGRARTCGLASTAINPASMYVLDEFIAIGTQIKTERPGKGTIGTPCNEIEGPIVLLRNGDLIQINDTKNIKTSEIKKIIDLGEILIPFGEFIENNALLPESGYVYEWWIQDLQKKIGCLPKNYTFLEVLESEEKTLKKIIEDFGKDVNLKQPDFYDAFEISKKYNIPLHPYYNLFWHDITVDDLRLLSNYVKKHGSFSDSSLILPIDNEVKKILIELGALHKQRQGNLILDRYSQVLIKCCGLDLNDDKIIETERFEIIKNVKAEDDVISLVSKLADVTIKPRSPIRIGTRMGRPEKAAARKMRPPPHVLFPIGNYGGNQRLIKDAADLIKINIEAGVRICPECKKKTHRIFCTCGKHTECFNGKIEIQEINLAEELKLAQKNVNERTLPATIKGVIGTISKNKTPEPLEKGLLRAKHNVPVFKDGTIRFDMTDAPVTHFKPREIGVTINRLRELGYKTDYLGNKLECEDQICELKVQDVIISKACAEFFVQVSRFIDDLLVKFYKLERFYNIKKLEDLIGHLVVGLAPHTSAGALSRIIGFTDAQVCYAHPFYHAAKRRNCLSSETNITIVDSKIPKNTKIKQFYCDVKSDEKIVDDFGTKQKKVEGISAYAFNFSNGKSELKNITSVLKIKAPKHLLKIKLKSGRNFIASPFHKVVVFSDEKIVTKKIVELKHDDKFLTYNNLNFTEHDIIEIDLLYEFLKIKHINQDIVIRNVNEFVKKCTEKLDGLQKTSNKLKINKKTFFNYISRDSIPLSIFVKLLETCNEKIESIPKDCFLGVKRNHSVVPRIININDQFMRILGYYLSEGHARFTKKNYYQISFACTEKDMRKDIIKCINDVFQIHPYQDKRCVCISNRIIHDFFVF